MRIVLTDIFSMKRFVLLLIVIGLSLFFSVSKLFAEDIGNSIVNNIDDNIEYNLENNISQEIDLITNDTNDINDINDTNDTNDTDEKSQLSIKDIFGDDQTFPFVAGFGKD